MTSRKQSSKPTSVPLHPAVERFLTVTMQEHAMEVLDKHHPNASLIHIEDALGVDLGFPLDDDGYSEF